MFYIIFKRTIKASHIHRNRNGFKNNPRFISKFVFMIICLMEVRKSVINRRFIKAF